jgi:hypothetical protein
LQILFAYGTIEETNKYNITRRLHNMVDEKLLQKIHNLFKLAEGNSNQNEAQNALLKAQELMAKNGIEQSEINQIVKPKEVIRENITEVGRLSWWEKSLSVVIARNFRTEIYINRTKYKGGSIVFLGLKDDVQLAKMVYNFAVAAILNDTVKFVKQYKKYHINYNIGVKNDYITGWIRGLDTQYKEQVNQNGWGLVLVKDPLVQAEISKMHLRKGQSSAITRGHDNGAYGKGFERGKSFNSPTGALRA